MARIQLLFCVRSSQVRWLRIHSESLAQVMVRRRCVGEQNRKRGSQKFTSGTLRENRNDSYTLHKILPSKVRELGRLLVADRLVQVDPLVSLMKVEKVPDSTYDMIGGLDQRLRQSVEQALEQQVLQQPKGSKDQHC